MRQGLAGQYARELAPEESFFKRKFEECQHELNAIKVPSSNSPWSKLKQTPS